ncbi:DUF1761 domain-containing protein [Fulvivirgaceae bacterium BMA10]|uniref:DUF1761 domain-containing protein n=1 Tax=Splendidivirga corallicola TaxID=3051826 RepID=A0ABT8KP36_9BACT|nr:DUF1761 domain-containing protein [Fulvivirgaceae bacterium BMA10]
MDLSNLNYLAIFIAALSTFLIGGLWYSPILFSKSWMVENGFSEEDLKGANMPMIFGGSFVLALIMSFNLAAFLSDSNDLVWGMTAGALAGIGWVAAAMGVTYLFERKSLKLFFINAGYHVITFIVMGAIVGVWK